MTERTEETLVAAGLTLMAEAAAVLLLIAAGLVWCCIGAGA
jgi:hypothetical protein